MLNGLCSIHPGRCVDLVWHHTRLRNHSSQVRKKAGVTEFYGKVLSRDLSHSNRIGLKSVELVGAIVFHHQEFTGMVEPETDEPQARFGNFFELGHFDAVPLGRPDKSRLIIAINIMTI